MARRGTQLKRRDAAMGADGGGAADGGFAGAWSWLFPLAYLLHAIEELWAGQGYAAWISSVSGQSLSNASLVTIHVGLLLAMTGVIAIVQRQRRFYWAVAGFAIIYVGNALLHVVMTVVSSSYSPGLVTGLLLWLPLGVGVGVFAWRTLPARDLAWGAVIGFVGTAVISTLALNPALIPLP